MTHHIQYRSQLTMGEIYDTNIVYTSRPSYVSNPWLAPDEHQSNFLTGRELLIAQLPVIVHEASITDKLQQLFQLIGETIPQDVIPFHDQESYEQTLKRLTKDEARAIYFQYVHGDDIVDAKHYAMDKQLFKDLNNKSLIPKWTDGQYVPEREIVAFKDFKAAVKQWELPLVIKPGDDLPTAGGYGVMICYNEEDLEKAIARVEQAEAATDTLIIEQCVEAVDNYCVQFARHPKDGIVYLGAAQQLTNDYGFYNGNVNAITVPEKVIQAGYEIMDIAVKKGFIGIAGFDLLVDKEGDVFAIDLNFRQNGSTSMLLLKDKLTGPHHKFYSYFANGDNARFFEAVHHFVERGVLYPLSYYDGDWYENKHVNSRFGCIWHADSPEQIEAYESQFKVRAGI
ncbi:L-aspartate--L-methionine ligase LdmS [Staphylococcus intermedius]|uniref:ATP-grasp domain protein n=1 Tax=Staphylococcus intermedius NCTC 11048 TaxID=1141106 RepID=A0A380G6G5_STAIN|nr:ATP-grasp domain-containing protein [Staphylococcus intermedius]PCF86113.1 ATP-grasp domain-containing protein [Staphylococcus intermedius]PNZ55379.1 ATP-grasp domain-containing protein [Staphylococcus intermedius NCTC 11048]SUM46107.1 ATP-grasp domain protein [Staphylococcus intermedius NCTC 11048]